MKLWIHGWRGRMGKAIRHWAAENNTIQVMGGSARDTIVVGDRGTHCDHQAWQAEMANCDLIVDFSSAAGNQSLLDQLQRSEKQSNVLVGTTALAPEQHAAWQQWAQDDHRLLFAPNTSLGIILTASLARDLARVLKPRGFDCEIHERHHRYKEDCPSGTAKYLAATIAEAAQLTPKDQRAGKRQPGELGLSSSRGGQIAGDHEISFFGDDEHIIIQHKAMSRRLFARGAIELGQWLLQQPPGAYHCDQLSPASFRG